MGFSHYLNRRHEGNKLFSFWNDRVAHLPRCASPGCYHKSLYSVTNYGKWKGLYIDDIQVISPVNKDVTLAATTNVLPAGIFYVMLPAVLLIALRCRRLSYMIWQVGKDNISCEALLMWRIHHLSYVNLDWFHSHFLIPGVINLQLTMCQVNHRILIRRIYHLKTTLSLIFEPMSQRLDFDEF